MLPLRNRTRRLPWRSVAHEQCLGRPLLVRSIDQDLVPGIGVDRRRIAELQHDTIWVDLSALDVLASLGGLFERASECRLARLTRGFGGLRGSRNGTVSARDNFLGLAIQRLGFFPLAPKDLEQRAFGLAHRTGGAGGFCCDRWKLGHATLSYGVLIKPRPAVWPAGRGAHCHPTSAFCKNI